MPRWFSPSWDSISQIWGCARNVKIGLASFFVMTYPQKRLCIHLYHKNLVRPQNMGAKLPTQRICHVLPWLRKTHRNWCVVHKHGFGWQIRSTGSSAPIFWVQSYRGAYSCIAYQSGECESYKTKIWDFSVPSDITSNEIMLYLK